MNLRVGLVLLLAGALLATPASAHGRSLTMEESTAGHTVILTSVNGLTGGEWVRLTWNVTDAETGQAVAADDLELEVSFLDASGQEVATAQPSLETADGELVTSDVELANQPTVRYTLTVPDGQVSFDQAVQVVETTEETNGSPAPGILVSLLSLGLLALARRRRA